MSPILPDTTHPKARRPYRQPAGMPKAREDWRMGSAVSVLIHLAIILAILGPFGALTSIQEIEQGAGGSGPAGGGGGGNRGTGRLRTEVLRFVEVAPPAPQPKPSITVPPPEQPTLPPLDIRQLKPSLTAKELEMPMPVGIGGGSGTDLTGGSGPGSGGGVGSGTGTGRGSGVGPGTGGGNQQNHPPTAIEMFIPPLPTPESVKGFRLVAEFDVDETGKVLAMSFTETKDRAYNRRIAEVLRGFRFRPGTRPDGTPIRMKAQVIITF